MTDTKHPITPTSDEKIMSQQLVLFMFQLLEAELGTDEAEKSFIDMMIECREQAYETLANQDLTKEDAVTLFHDTFLGEATKAYFVHLYENEDEQIRPDEAQLEQIWSDKKGIITIALCAKQYHLIRARGELCEEEILRRLSRVDEALISFISLQNPKERNVRYFGLRV